MIKYAFTFGSNHRDFYGNNLSRAYVVVEAKSYEIARDIMFSKRGNAWSFQYEWDEFKPQIEQFNLHEVHLGDL